MNLPIDPNDLPPPSAEEVVTRFAAQQPQPSKHPSLKVIGVAAAALIGFGLLTALGGSDDDSESTSVSADAGTGNASVDKTIVDVIWAGSSGRAAICPSFQDIRETMPSLSDDEIFDMGVRLAGGMDEVTPAQLERLRELALRDC